MTTNDLVATREPAWTYLLEQQICALPVDVVALAERNGYHLLSYRHYSALTGLSGTHLIKEYDKDGFVFWSDKRGQYVICYNEKMPCDVVRWTLMHEIAHIVLKHVSPAVPVLKRIRGEDRPVIEGLADSFTRRVLCPSIVLHECHAINPNTIATLCGISFTAAEFRSEYMKKLERRNRFLSRPLEIKVYQQFRGFIERYNYKNYKMEISKDLFYYVVSHLTHGEIYGDTHS